MDLTAHQIQKIINALEQGSDALERIASDVTLIRTALLEEADEHDRSERAILIELLDKCFEVGRIFLPDDEADMIEALLEREGRNDNA